MSTPIWIPAPKRGIVPLHPLDFGTILGRSFAMLRHNPAVLLGFGICMQLIVGVLSLGVFGLLFATSFSRLDTLSPNNPDYAAIMAGTFGLSLGAGLLLSLFSVVVGSAVQGVVAANLRSAMLGERPRLGEVWRQVKPVFWRLVGYSLLVTLGAMAAILVIVAIAVALAVGLHGSLGDGGIAVGVVVGILLLLGFTAVGIWIGTKILLVPTALVIERCTIREAFRRSWHLTRGRFWVAFGAVTLVGLIVGVAANAVSGVTQMFAMLLFPVLLPTGDPLEGDALSPSSTLAFLLVMLVPQLLTLVIGAVGTIAQNTAAGLVYLDSRMRKEGLDQALGSYVEHRALGWAPEQLGDPYTVPQFAAWAQQYPGAQPQYPAQQYPAQQQYPGAQ